VFSIALGGLLPVRNFVQNRHNLQAERGLRQQRFQDLRHATANLLMNPDAASLADVSKIWRHSPLGITNDFYKHFSVGAQAVSVGI
jgi:hypothetical protein